jgi:hypothetical protein
VSVSTIGKDDGVTDVTVPKLVPSKVAVGNVTTPDEFIESPEIVKPSEVTVVKVSSVDAMAEILPMPCACISPVQQSGW